MRQRYSFSSRRTGQARDPKNIRKQKKKFPKILEEVIHAADILVQILDARFIQETRNLEIEKEIKKQNKKLIFIINKADLKETKLKNPPKPYVVVSGKKRTGIKHFRDLIKREANKLKTSGKINIGIIGYPNTGKSTLINLLIGKKSAPVGKFAGHTKGMQKVKLSEHLMLLDSPGVIPKEEYTQTEYKKLAKHAKVNARTYAQVKDPEHIVTQLMKDYAQEIQKHYHINAKKNAETLIETLGKKLQYLKKGGAVNVDKTARKIIKDFQEGVIKI